MSNDDWAKREGESLVFDFGMLWDLEGIEIFRTEDPIQARKTMEAFERSGLEFEPCVADQPDWEVLETLNKILDEFKKKAEDPDYEIPDEID